MAGNLAFAGASSPLTQEPTLARQEPNKDQVPVDPFTPIAYPPGELILVYVDQYGIPGAVVSNPNSATPTYMPGQGNCVIYDFDTTGNTGLGVGDDADPVQIFNWSQFPVSGAQLIQAYMMLGVLWVVPPRECHGIIATPTAPCVGNTPDTSGTVTTYYRSAGVMTPDQVLPLESWYNVTAAANKHCGIFWIDARASLEVLDC